MNILYLINDAETGGAQTLIRALASADSENQYHLVVLRKRGALSDSLELVMDSVTYLNITRSFRDLLSSRQRLLQIIDQNGISVVHSHLLQSDILAASLPNRIAKMSTLHTSGNDSVTVSGRLSLFARKLTRKRFALTVACSASAKEFGEKRLALEETEVIGNGIRIQSPSRYDGAPPEVILSLARFHPMKDHGNLFAAFRQVLEHVPSATLLCAGSGITDENDLLARLRERHGLDTQQVQFLGSRDDIPELLASSSCLVISSDRGEALPIAGIEALANSRPVITTDVGDCHRLATRKSYVVPAGAPSKLAAAIVGLLLEDTESFGTIQGEAYSLAASEFDIKNTCSAYLSAYSQVERAHQ